jgi:hypothetical protein
LVRLARKRKTRFLKTTSRAGNRTIRFCFGNSCSL